MTVINARGMTCYSVNINVRSYALDYLTSIFASKYQENSISVSLSKGDSCFKGCTYSHNNTEVFVVPGHYCLHRESFDLETGLAYLSIDVRRFTTSALPQYTAMLLLDEVLSPAMAHPIEAATTSSDDVREKNIVCIISTG